jgi:hypothetical protein
MKKITVTGLLFFLVLSVSLSQEKYSKENLGKTSREDLDLYLGKAQKLKTNGIILSVAGPVAMVVGIAAAGAAWSGGSEGSYKFGVGMIFIGLGSTLVGLPMLAVGSTRVKNVKKAISASQGVSIQVAPYSFYNYTTEKIQPGIRLRVIF